MAGKKATRKSKRKRHAAITKPGVSRAELGRQKTRRGMELLIRHAARPYRAASELMREFGCTRRTATDILSRARVRFAARRDELLSDLGDVLAYRLDDVFLQAMATNDLNSAIKAAVELDRLIVAAGHQAGKQPITAVDFEIVPFSPCSEDDEVAA